MRPSKVQKANVTAVGINPLPRKATRPALNSTYSAEFRARHPISQAYINSVYLSDCPTALAAVPSGDDVVLGDHKWGIYDFGNLNTPTQVNAPAVSPQMSSLFS